MPKSAKTEPLAWLTPEQGILRAIGEASKRKGTDTFTPTQIDRIIAKARNRKHKR